MSGSDPQRQRRVWRSTILLGLFAFAVYAGFIIMSINRTP